MRASRAIRIGAWTLVAAGAAAPAVRRRLRLPGPAVLAAAATAPAALTVVVPPSRVRAAVVCSLQMWAYLAAYEMPNDDPQALRDRVHIDYPIDVDRVLGLGQTPTQRLQRAFAVDGEISPFERLLVWCHWLWFGVPHGTVAYMLLRHPERFGAAASRLYGVFDAGAVVYWALPTAPPWYAAQLGRMGGPEAIPVRRMMTEYGEAFWGERWGELFEALGGNPLAAMPSLHFATSLMAARILAETGPVAGAVGYTYAGLLGLALVYLGEHYAVDLIAGAALAEGVHRTTRRFGWVGPRVTAGLERLRRLAGGG